MHIPIDASVNDVFRNGPQEYGLGQIPKDAVQNIVELGPHAYELTKLHALGAVHGAHAPLSLFRERELSSHSRRLPGTGLSSSMLSLELLMDREDRIRLGEFYQMPCPVAAADRMSVHERVDMTVTGRR